MGYTTLRVTEKFRDKLFKLKLENESYESFIERELIKKNSKEDSEEIIKCNSPYHGNAVSHMCRFNQFKSHEIQPTTPIHISDEDLKAFLSRDSKSFLCLEGNPHDWKSIGFGMSCNRCDKQAG